MMKIKHAWHVGLTLSSSENNMHVGQLPWGQLEVKAP